MCTLYYSTQLASYIVCFDINNLYGFVMSQKLPHNRFEWVSSCEVSKLQDALMNGYETAITYFETIWINDLNENTF